MATEIVEQCSVAPSFDTATELLLPLLYSDMVFLPLSVHEILIFYDIQYCSESHFLDTVVPNLKNSLSLTLKHFCPLAGKIIFPLTSGMPLSQYISGDSISLTIAMSRADLIPLTGNLSRDADQFHNFIARLPPATYSPDFIKFSVAAIQVTLFPNQGICISITNQHAICDVSIVVRFLQMWASMNKLNGDELSLLSGHQTCLSFYDRVGIQNAGSLAASYWDRIKMLPPVVQGIDSPPRNRNLATFVLSGTQIQKLKDSVTTKNTSTFAIVCAHLWTCFATSAASAGEVVADDDMEYLMFVADCRGRLNPALPENYFGNCLAFLVAECPHGKLKGERGITAATEAIGEALRKGLENDDTDILRGSMERLLELERVLTNGNRRLTIAGSPRFDVYTADFGWGRPKKFQLVQAHPDGSVALCKSRDFEGGVEIGLSMPEAKVDAFADIFNQCHLGHANLSKL